MTTVNAFDSDLFTESMHGMARHKKPEVNAHVFWQTHWPAAATCHSTSLCLRRRISIQQIYRKPYFLSLMAMYPMPHLMLDAKDKMEISFQTSFDFLIRDIPHMPNFVIWSTHSNQGISGPVHFILRLGQKEVSR